MAGRGPPPGNNGRPPNTRPAGVGNRNPPPGANRNPPPGGNRKPWQGPLDVADKKPETPDYVRESMTATLPRFQATVHVGDRIRDKHSKREGVCMFVGSANFAKGKEVCGLRLDRKRSTTDCDGKYHGERYFRCTPGHGLYIPLEDAEFIGVAGDEEFADLANAAPAKKMGGGRPSGGGPKDDDTPLPPDADFDLEKELAPIAGLEEVKDMLRNMRNMVEVRCRRRSLIHTRDERTRVDSHADHMHPQTDQSTTTTTPNPPQVRRRRSHMGVDDERTMHMLFLGNPGTGKTKVARLVATMFHQIGVLKKGHLVEVTRKVRRPPSPPPHHPMLVPRPIAAYHPVLTCPLRP